MIFPLNQNTSYYYQPQLKTAPRFAQTNKSEGSPVEIQINSAGFHHLV